MKKALTIVPKPQTPTTTMPLSECSFVPTPENGRLEFSDFVSNPSSPNKALSTSTKNPPLTFLANINAYNAYNEVEVAQALSFEDIKPNVVKDSSEKENSTNLPRAVLT